MLERCSRWLTDNGFLIYSVCSLLKEEGENQIDKFLSNNKRFIGVHSVKISTKAIWFRISERSRNENNAIL